jgi:hypothetical protein
MKALVLSAIAMVMAATSSADIVHSVRFQSGPQVMVWGDAERGASDIIPGQVPVMVGRLVSAQKAQTSATFRVASNTGFKIVADTSDFARMSAAELSGSIYTIQIADVGPNADAATFQRGITHSGTLAELLADPSIFRSFSRTAASAGKPGSQAVTFVAAWSSPSGPVNMTFDVVASAS